MSPRNAVLYYPSWNPSVRFVRSTLLFFDRIEVIVPTQVENPEYENENARLFDLIPDAFNERRQRNFPLELSERGWQRFGIALDAIAAARNERNIKIESEFPGATQIMGVAERCAMLHEGKTDDTIKKMLTERNLWSEASIDLHHSSISDGVQNELKSRDLAGDDGDEFHRVNYEASCLILSLIADSLSVRHGLRSITDEHVGFSLNMLSDTEYAADPTPSIVAASTINAEVPRTIEVLTPEEYVELRKKYSGIREVFQESILQFCEKERLYLGRDELNEQIRTAVEKFQAEVETFRKTSDIGEWGPFFLGSLGAAASTAGSLSQNTPLQLLGLGLAVAVNYYPMVFPASTPDDTMRCQRLIGKMRGDLIDYKLLRRLIIGRDAP